MRHHSKTQNRDKQRTNDTDRLTDLRASERKREASWGGSELGEASLEQGDDGGVLVALGKVEGSGAITSSEARISLSQQQGSDDLQSAFLRGNAKGCEAVIWAGLVNTSASSQQSVNDQSVVVQSSDHQR